MPKKPEFVLNENLRFVPKDPSILQAHIEDLKKNLEQITEPKNLVSHLGEIGVYLRQLDSFKEAETYLQQALELIAQNNLGIAKEVQQKIRLAHVWQEMKAFGKSNSAFTEIIHICRTNKEASPYLDFALQHAGKNEFDQGRYQSALDHFREALELRLKKNSPADQIESTQAAIRRAQELIKMVDSKLRKAPFIRRAVVSDAEAIATININSWKSTYPGVIDQSFLDSLEIGPRIPGAVKRIQREDLDCFVAFDPTLNRVIGFADFGPCRDKSVEADSELYAIYLDDNFKGKGIGQKLFQEGYQATKKRAYKRMMVSVFEKNDTARSFYEKMGGQLLNISQLELSGVQYPTMNYIWDFREEHL